ncbi:hypothetical protein SDC9_174721 [bioreactor metagenome]|uniref:Uncharacterized protein n=1 Tax=bioreactor metagenome TaxID=1076179 RepID=A0A645GM99_9ZZZZ
MVNRAHGAVGKSPGVEPGGFQCLAFVPETNRVFADHLGSPEQGLMNVCKPADREPLSIEAPVRRCTDALAAFGVCALKPHFCAASIPKSAGASHLHANSMASRLWAWPRIGSVHSGAAGFRGGPSSGAGLLPGRACPCRRISGQQVAARRRPSLPRLAHTRATASALYQVNFFYFCLVI